MMMIVPVDSQIDETQDIAKENRNQRLQRCQTLHRRLSTRVLVLDYHHCLHPTKPMAKAIYESTPVAHRVGYRTDWLTRSSAWGGPTSTETFVKFHEDVEGRLKELLGIA